MPTRVLVADDHTIVRQGLVGLLRAAPDIEVVGEAARGTEALAKAEALTPDVVVLDISMPEMNGFEVALRLRKSVPRTRVLILTMHEDDEYVLRMVHAGAAGYLVKDGAASELVEAIRALKAGKTHFGARAAEAIADAYQSGREAPVDPFERLTPRERQVCSLVLEGRTNAQIAAALGVSPKTVDNHRTHLMEKLAVHSTTELVRLAAKHNLLT